MGISIKKKFFLGVTHRLWAIALFRIYFVVKIVTVAAVRASNQEGERYCESRWRQTFFEGESISLKIRYICSDILKTKSLTV